MREIYKIYLSHFFSGFAFIASFSTLYYLANGLTQYQISILFSVFTLSLAIFQIPTGGFADTFGHRTSVFWGTVIYAISLFITAIAKDFSGFLVAMVLSSLGFALISGAYSSLIHDILDKLRKSDQFERIQGRAFAANSIASVLGAATGGFLYQMNPRFTYIAAGIGVTLSALMVLLIKWEFVRKGPAISTYLNRTKNGVILTLKNSKLVAIIIIYTALVIGGFVYHFNLKLPYLTSIQFSVIQIGFIISIVSAFSAIVSANSYKISKKAGSLNSLILIVIVTAASIIMMSMINTQIGLMFYLFYGLAYPYREVVFTTLQQKEAAKENRATVMSTVSFISSISVAITVPFFGKIIDSKGISYGLLLVGVFILLLSAIGIFLYSKSHKSLSN